TGVRPGPAVRVGAEEAAAVVVEGGVVGEVNAVASAALVDAALSPVVHAGGQLAAAVDVGAGAPGAVGDIDAPDADGVAAVGLGEDAGAEPTNVFLVRCPNAG